MPHPSSPVELDLVTGVWVGQPQSMNVKRADPTTCLFWGGTGAKMPLTPLPLPPSAAGKVAHRVMSSRELALALTS